MDVDTVAAQLTAGLGASPEGDCAAADGSGESSDCMPGSIAWRAMGARSAVRAARGKEQEVSNDCKEW